MKTTLSPASPKQTVQTDVTDSGMILLDDFIDHRRIVGLLQESLKVRCKQDILRFRGMLGNAFRQAQRDDENALPNLISDLQNWNERFVATVHDAIKRESTGELSSALTRLVNDAQSPNSLLTHPQIKSFCITVSHAAQSAREGVGASTPGQIKTGIVEIDVAARQFEYALKVHSTAAIEVLSSHFDYLVMRNNETNPVVVGRPEVPQLPHDTPRLEALIERIRSDIEALKIGCDYAASRIKPDANARLEKDTARELTRQVAAAFHSSFGTYPPGRSWFGNDFMPTVGLEIGLVIGQQVVGDVVKELSGSVENQ